MTTQGTGTSGAASVKSAGLVYKIGLGVILVGIIIAASSWLLGGVTFSVISALLRLLGAPEDRALLAPNQPEAGGQLLQLFGVILLACGSCIVSLRLIVELFGMVGNYVLTFRLKRVDKLGLGAVAIGFLVGVSSGLTQVLLYEIFLYEYGTGTAMSTLETAGYAGGLILLGGLAVLILRRPGPRRVLLGWTDRVGWGKINCGWINKLALGLLALALAGGTLGFEEPTTIVAAAGIGIFVVGIVPHILADGRP